MDCCVSTEMLLAVEQAEMEIRDGGNYWYRLGRNVAFERQFLMCKLVPSCTLRKYFPIAEEGQSAAACRWAH